MLNMEGQNKQQNDTICSLFSLLESANLVDYYERFLEQGGDDINQLCDASEEEFKEITKLVGMQTKPLHIRRLQKSLVEWKNKTAKSGIISSNSSSTLGRSWMDKWNSNQTSYTKTGIKITKPTTTILTITSPNLGENISVVSVTDSKKRGRPPNAPKSAKKLKSGVFELKLPPMEAIIDWESLDEERKQLIREHSRIYGRDSKKRKTHALNGHEQMINEAAAQLCLRDPTLLVRRDELFTQARRIIRDSGFSFVHGHSRSKYAGESQEEESTTGAMTPASKIKRQERLNEIEQLLENSRQREEVLTEKKKEFEQLNLPISDIRQELSNLQRQVIALQTEQKELQKRQRRSERYYSSKGNRRKSSSTLSVDEGGEVDDSDVHMEGISSENVCDQESSQVVGILQQASDGRTRVDQPSDEESCGLFTIIPQNDGIQTESVTSQAIRASLLSGAPVDSTINALLSLSSDDKANNMQALQNVLSQIALPHLVQSSANQQLVAHVITTTSQDPQTMQYVQQSRVPHLANCGSSNETTQPVVTTTSQDHTPVTNQILQESQHMTHMLSNLP